MPSSLIYDHNMSYLIRWFIFNASYANNILLHDGARDDHYDHAYDYHDYVSGCVSDYMMISFVRFNLRANDFRYKVARCGGVSVNFIGKGDGVSGDGVNSRDVLH